MKAIHHVIPILLSAALAGCGGGSDESVKKQAPPTPQSMVKKEPAGPDKGVGPIKSIDLPEAVDDDLAAKGKAVFEAKCTACHKVDKRFVGPPLAGITERREPEWIMNMILNPEVMVKENEAARALLAEYMSPMANQNLTEEEARSILEYFRTL